MAIGQVCTCKSNNNGEPLFFWERWKTKDFLFKKGKKYLFLVQENSENKSQDLYVITEDHRPVLFDPQYFKYLFRY